MRQMAFRPLILEALAMHDGRASRQEVFSAIEGIADLSADDWHELEDGLPRWRKSVDFVVLRMRGSLLKSSDESPRGIWELSDEGWDRVDDLGLDGSS